MPRTREGIREYFERMRPRLAARILRPGAWIVGRVLRAATVATLPRWQRNLANLRQPRAIDVLVRLPMRLAFRVAAMSGRLQLLALRMISPSTVPVAAPMLLGIPAKRDETLTPAEAFARHDVPTPAELSSELRPDDGDSLEYPPSAPAVASPERAAVSVT